MKKYTEKDIEKMLSKTEKTEASFDLGVSFPVATVRPRRRFASLLVAACLAMLVVSSAIIVAFVQNESSLTEYSTNSGEILSKPDFSNNPENSDHASVDFENSGSFEHSKENSGNSDSDDVTRDPQGGFDNSGDDTSDEDVSDDKPVLPSVVYPENVELFANNGIGTLTLEEYFDSNPIKNLIGVKELSLYNRSAISVDKRKDIIDKIGKGFGISLIFDESLFKSTGDCRGFNNKTKFSVNVGEYGDWFIYLNNEKLLQFSIFDGDIPNETRVKIENLVKTYSEVFVEEGYKFSYVYTQKQLEVRLCVDSDDEVLSKIPKYILTFKNLSGNQYSLFSVECSGANMTSIGSYPLRTYSQALKDFFQMEITEDNYPDSSENYEVEFSYVGYDVRYLSYSKCDFMYPYYAFIVQFDPYGEETRYKAFFVPAIESEYLQNIE